MSPSIRNQAKLAGIALAAGLALTAFGAGDASAQARKTTVDCVFDQNTGDIFVSGQIKGVGNEDLCVVASTTFDAECACRNNGGNCPSDANKQTVTFPTDVGQIATPTNGQINFSDTLDAPDDTDCQDALDCPGGQTAILAAVEADRVVVNVYDSFTLTDTTTCEPTMNATAIRTGTCRLSGGTVTFDEECAALFD